MRRGVLIASLLFAGAAQAQTDDRDYLTGFLEDSLSGAGRTVTVTGFTGALSSQASITRLTIADDAGIWLTLDDVVLDWSRSSLLSGELVVNQLTAAKITMTRLPVAEEGAMPAPEASGFSLPELPVSVDIDRIAAESIALGPDVLGQAVEGSLEASMSLSGGAGEAAIDLLRTGDGPKGEIVLDASYDNASGQLALSLQASEDAEGIVVGLLGVPGAPAAEFSLEGSGPVDGFNADIRLATDGEDRLAGTVTLQGADEGGYRFAADVAGNLAPVLLPEQVDFFGANVALKLEATRSTSGRMSLDQFSLRARSLQLIGKAQLAADGLPEEISVKGTLASPDGSPVLLPFGEVPTHVGSAEFTLEARQGDGAGWKGVLDLQGLDRADLKVAQVVLGGSGRIGRTPAGNSFGGTLQLDASGVLPTDPALATALGTSLKGGLKLSFLEGSGALSLSDLQLDGDDYSGSGAIRIEGLEEAFLTSGRLVVTAEDFARFSLLAGRQLGGKGTATLEGSASRLSGVFDLVAGFQGEGLSLDIPQIDGLLIGATTAQLSAVRDENGTVLRGFDLKAEGLTANAAGKLSSSGSDLTGKLDLADLSKLGPGYGGAISLEAAFTGTPKDGRITLGGSGTGLRLGQAEADRLLAGTSRLDAVVAVKDAVLQIESARLANPQLALTADGEISGATRKLNLEARLANLGLLIPDLQGPLTFAGEALQDAAGYRLDLSGKGPGQVDARVSGRVATNFGAADLQISGAGQAGLANLFIAPRAVEGPVRYDLRLKGPIRPASLSGRITLSNGRVTDPGLGFAFDQVEALAQLQNGQARISATAGLSTGGRLRIDGPVGLSAPYRAELAVVMEGLRIYDPELYEARLTGNVTLSGPLAGGASIAGRLVVTEAELQVPSSGFSTADELMDIRHRNEPREVRATRVRAGLLGGESGEGGRSPASTPFRLDLSISAPNQIFVRGRGIDAELGGELRLLGTTAAVAPAGAFHLIRGRMDILGKRLVLSQADLQMEGSFVPVIDIAASTESDGITSYVRVEGPADNPEVSFTSTPELPQEEVIALLLFGRGLESISALQAAQLANAVAVLAGRGGTGLVGKLRQGFGLDDLDLVTSDDGSAALKAGKYISDNVYTEVEVEQGGKTSINLNLELREGITVKGRLGADGETGIGIFMERDY